MDELVMMKKINLITTDDDQHDALATRKLVQDSRMLPAGNEVETPHPIERAQPSPRSRPSFLLSRRMKFIYIFAILLVLLALLVNGIVLTLGHHQDVPPLNNCLLDVTKH